ncbi:MAG: ABC transporter permease subunit [Desulfobacterales bacterium]|nr:ABC transporter permease subunit [Desulfobacterales bacterium]
MKAARLQRLFTAWAWAATLTLVTAMAIILGFLIYQGWHTLTPRLIFGNTPAWDALTLARPVFEGLFPALVGTLALVLTAVALAVPLGIGAGIFLAEYCPPKPKGVFSLIFDILAGIPSIVVGLFGFSLTILLHQLFGGRIYPCLLISAISLAFLVLPYIIRTTQLSLQGLAPAVRLTALGLGATKFQNIVHVLVPASFSHILGGVILAVGRCAEDTAVIMLTGAVAAAGIPKFLLSGYEALPFYIYYISSQYADDAELARGYGACLLLLALCLTLFGLARWLQRRVSQRILYRP